MDKVLLHIEHLTKRYDKDTVALRDVSIDFKEGDFVVVIGPSGAGKSTLIRCINRMIDATDGKILFDGQEISGARGQKLRVPCGKACWENTAGRKGKPPLRCWKRSV